MTLVSRRLFLKNLGVGSLVTVVPGNFLLQSVKATQDLSDCASDLPDLAIQTARSAGAEYADIRVCHYAWQYISLRDRVIEWLDDAQDSGFGVRVLVNGVWGFAAGYAYSAPEVNRLTLRAVAIAKQAAHTNQTPVRLVSVPVYQASYQTPYQIDPVDVPFSTKMDLLFSLNDTLLSKKGIVRANSFLYLAREDKLFCSSEGSRIQQRIVRSNGGFTATVASGDDFETRSFILPPRTSGWEHVQNAVMLDQIDRVAEEAQEKIKAEKCPQQVRRDLITMPSHLWLTIHESVGHPTELDRVLGWEANFAGTSFATPDQLNRLQYGSKLVNFRADRTDPGGMATCGYDDEGVKTMSWLIVQQGRLVNYQTSRETAAILGQSASNACMFADSWVHPPIIRIPNLSLMPDPNGPSLDELIADTKNGILIDGNGSYSIDQQRRNFQFGGDAFWEIKNGHRTKMLRQVTYQSYTTEFWNSVDAICNPAFFQLYGTSDCGKGQPYQTGQMSHGAAPTRIKNILVGVA
ncbi:TldD/PmbA family protein [bacterium]|nr:TldD/PmbA family protein [bacterium]